MSYKYSVENVCEEGSCRRERMRRIFSDFVGLKKKRNRERSSVVRSHTVSSSCLRVRACAWKRRRYRHSHSPVLPLRDTVAPWRQYPWLHRRYHFSLNYKYREWRHLHTRALAHTHTTLCDGRKQKWWRQRLFLICTNTPVVFPEH